MANRYNTRSALAAAVYAFEQNNEYILKEAQLDPDNGVVLNYPNKTIVYNYFANDPDPQVPCGISPGDLEVADQLKDYLQQAAIMQALQSSDGQVNEFLNSVNQILEKEEVPARDIGILIWAPKLALDHQAQEKARVAISNLGSTSQYLARIGDKIELHFTLIDKRFIKNAECYLVQGHDEHGNLVSYWAREERKIFNNVKITAKVKGHRHDKYRNAKFTMINFVKAVTI
jgi:hypothetical protein